VIVLLYAEISVRAFRRPVDVAFGRRSTIRIRGDADRAVTVLEAPVPDWPEMQAWRRHLRPGDLFVDVGAHLGMYALWALEHGAEVIAVEPNPVVAGFLSENLELNGYTAEVQTCAVGNEIGTMYLSGPSQDQLAIRPEPPGRPVEVTTLDVMLRDRGPIAGLKIDIEGAERLALDGASELLESNQPALIQIEWNSCSEQLLGESRQPIADRLRAAGYWLARPDDSGRLVRDDASAYGPDIFAVRKTLR
jgi:FkbM family methyltransferase